MYNKEYIKNNLSIEIIKSLKEYINTREKTKFGSSYNYNENDKRYYFIKSLSYFLPQNSTFNGTCEDILKIKIDS